MSNIIKAPQSKKDRRRVLLQRIEPSVYLDQDTQELSESPEALEQKLLQRVEQTQSDIRAMVREAEEKVLQAELDIEEKKAAFIKECEIARAEEKTRGFEEGYHQGHIEGRESYQSLIAETNRWIREAEQRYNQIVQEAEPQMLNLSILVSEAILNQTLNDHQNWLPLVKRALVEVKDQDHFKITVSPKWYSFLTEQKQELTALIQESPLFIYVDEAFNENDCLIETPSGQLHASVDSQLQVIKNTLIDLLEENAL